MASQYALQNTAGNALTLTHNGQSQTFYVTGEEPVTFTQTIGNAHASATLDGVAIAQAADGGSATAVYMSAEQVRKMIGGSSGGGGGQPVTHTTKNTASDSGSSGGIERWQMLYGRFLRRLIVYTILATVMVALAGALLKNPDSDLPIREQTLGYSLFVSCFGVVAVSVVTPVYRYGSRQAGIVLFGFYLLAAFASGCATAQDAGSCNKLDRGNGVNILQCRLVTSLVALTWITLVYMVVEHFLFFKTHSTSGSW